MDKGIGGLDALYREVIMEHHRYPRNKEVLADADFKLEGFNPLCGDRIELFVKLDGGTIKNCCFEGEGCSICMASASMMTEEVLGKSKEEACAYIESFRMAMKGEECPLKIEGDLESLLGVRNFPVRIKCALLPWTTLNQILEDKTHD
ncbi:MAG: SUF system NifU family Fe-S cluster assembly protein [Oligoflexia bacterium]|nr:SUF system NifU family Fe-S cluster assembly protein [Oligoflexia bacterium]